PASVDSVLREILEAEVSSHLETMDAWLASARQSPAPATDALLRAIHTMNGAFAMTDVPEITAVTDAAETFIKRALGGGQPVEADAVDAIAGTTEAIRGCILALQSESPRIARHTALVGRLQALAAALPEVSWPQSELVDDGVEPMDDGVDLPVELTGIGDLSAYLTVDMPDEAPASEEQDGGAEAASSVAGDGVATPQDQFEPAEAASPVDAASADDASPTDEAVHLEQVTESA